MIKIASKSEDLDNFSKSGDLKTFSLVFSDLDRYCSDKYELELTMRETKEDYSLSCVAFQSHIGIMCLTRYWHYNKNELDEANKAFEAIRKIATAARDKFEYERIPPVLLSNHLTVAFKEVDPVHREKCYVPHVNYARKAENSPDIRENIYGGRYPDANIRSYSDRDGVFMEQHKKVVTEKTGRQQIKKYEQK